jgi:hypothetical protein
MNTSAIVILISLAGMAPEPAESSLLGLKRDGAYGFPQAQAKVLWDDADLRFSVWNDAQYLFVQAIVWKDDDDTLGETSDGRSIGDTAALSILVDPAGQETVLKDRVYYVNPWPHKSGLYYGARLSAGAWTTLRLDLRSRGSVRYVMVDGERKVRVDSMLIPLTSLAKKPGETLWLAYHGMSPHPRLTVNSVGYRPPASEKGYYVYNLPREKYHKLQLVERPAGLDLKQVPDGRDDPQLRVKIKPPT